MKKIPLLLLLILTMFTFAACSIYRDGFTEEYPLEGAARLKIISRNGPVSVTGWEKDYVHMQVNWQVEGDVDGRVEEFGRAIKVVPCREDDLLVLTVSHPPRPRFVHSVSVSIELEVPREKINHITVETSNGAMSFYHLQVGLTGRSTNGRITVEDCAGEINLETTNGRVVLNKVRFLGTGGRVVTTNGRIEADIALPRTGNFLLQSTNGRINLLLPAWTEGIVRMETSNGDIVLEEMPPVRLLRSGKNLLEIEMNEGGMRLEVKTSNGHINLGESRSLYPVVI